MARKCILSCILSCILITNVHASGFEAQIPQAAQAIVTGVAVAVGVATKIIRPVDPQKDLPEIIIQEQPQSILQESISEQASQLYKQSILDALSKPDASYKQIPQKSTLQNIVLKQAQPTPIPSPPVEIQPQPVLLPKVRTTKAALHAAQKLQPQKQTVEIQHGKEPVKAIQQNIPVPQKQISQQSSQNLQHTPVSFEFNE